MKFRKLAAFAAASTLAVTLGACGGSEAATDTADAGASSSENFPVTIESALGSATIEDKPERVVTLGWGSSDTVVALGTTPVGIEEVSWGNDEYGNYPWVTEAIQERGDELPQTFTGGQDIDFDAIIALQPDLIVAPLSGITQADFDILNDLAPTVAYPETAWHLPWKDQIEIIGTALGEPEAAQDEIELIETTLADAAAANPEFAGKTFAYIYAGGDPGSLAIYSEGDARVDVISALGFELAPAVADLPTTAGGFTAEVGLEQANLLDDVDVLFTWYNSEAEQEATESQRLFQQIPAVKRDSVVRNLDRQLGMASSFLTPLSVPWSLDKFLPSIESAVAKVN